MVKRGIVPAVTVRVFLGVAVAGCFAASAWALSLEGREGVVPANGFPDVAFLAQSLSGATALHPYSNVYPDRFSLAQASGVEVLIDADGDGEEDVYVVVGLGERLRLRDISSHSAEVVARAWKIYNWDLPGYVPGRPEVVEPDFRWLDPDAERKEEMPRENPLTREGGFGAGVDLILSKAGEYTITLKVEVEGGGGETELEVTVGGDDGEN